MTSGTSITMRSATLADVDRMVDAITTAFFDDPLWGPAFPDPDRRASQASAFWRLFVTSSLRYPWTRVTNLVEAVAVWIPPGGNELTDQELAGCESFLVELAGRPAAERILELFEEFERARPSEPHFYLSLLATHDHHRGGGLGMSLLRQSLAQIDELGLPVYLESSNPANDKRYASVGFAPRGMIAGPAGQVVTTMWRPAR